MEYEKDEDELPYFLTKIAGKEALVPRKKPLTSFFIREDEVGLVTRMGEPVRALLTAGPEIIILLFKHLRYSCFHNLTHPDRNLLSTLSEAKIKYLA